MRLVMLLTPLVALIAFACGGEEAGEPAATETAVRITVAQPSPTTAAATLGKIAFSCGPDICVVNADGSGFANLTQSPQVSDFGSPRWSPDGGSIAFTSYRDGNNEIYVMRADGSGLTNLTNSPTHEGAFSWSPDGSRIAFWSSDRDGGGGLYTMNADGSGVTRLADDGGGSGWEPEWSPDGSRIAFATVSEYNGRPPVDYFYDVYVVNADGSGRTRLTNQIAGTEREGLPFAWSPDGTRLVVQGAHAVLDAGTNTDIYVVNADGSGLTNFTNSRAHGRDPVWSPDGSRIAFWDPGIFVINPDGSGLTNLTADGFLPVWSPDGARIAFMSSRDGNREVYVMNADGSGQTRLTNTPEDEYAPQWQPQR